MWETDAEIFRAYHGGSSPVSVFVDPKHGVSSILLWIITINSGTFNSIDHQ